MAKLTHTDSSGKARMVDVSTKKKVYRTAKAEGFIKLQEATIKLIKGNEMKKGDVLQLARLSGIHAAKKTAELIFLAHPLNLTHIDVDAALEQNGIRVTAGCRLKAETGVEMEALTAVNAALLNIYDMCKGVDSEMMISDIHLIEKTKETYD
jgi:cyclic pyranopterin phosphate synthase